ncbi:MAG: ATP-grasp domain-containing protein [Deltaproteobacteria bacterium]|nr:ATP-grasp domain-containing protein [Deltaproteobacteria bacterium]
MTPSMKRLMILGAGPNQLPAIQKAVDLGFYVITADYLPQNVGHRFSHQSVNCSTLDQEGILQAAKELDIDGVMTMASDVATPTVGFVAEQLALPGGFPSAANILSNKASFRVFQREHGFHSPRFIVGSQLENVAEGIATLSPPLMFKPVDTSGSRGISKVDKVDKKLNLAAFESAQEYSRSKRVCVEEFVEGVDVSGDGFLLNGRFGFALITQKYKNGFVVTGHSLPTTLSAEDQRRVLAEVAANCKAAGYTDGPLDFDVRVSPEHVTVLEMSPRRGNGIPMIIERGTGVDLIAATICFALGEKVDVSKRWEDTRGCGSWIFGSEHGGILEKIATDQEVSATIPEIFEYVVHYQIGERVPHFIHSAANLGYVLFDCPSEMSYTQRVKKIEEALGIRVI